MRAACALVLAAWGGQVGAQEALGATPPAAGAGAGRWPVFFEPSITVRQTVTSNVRLSEPGESDAITEVSPQLRMRLGTGPVQGSLDYTLSGLLYARNSRDNSLRQSLAASGRAELVERRVFLDAGASISREAGSLLPTAPADSGLINDGRTEVASLQLSPHVRGSFGNWADYEARLSWSATRAKDSPADSYANSASFRLAAPGSASRRLGWSLTGSHQSSRFVAGTRTESDRIDAALLYGLSPELRLSARVGHEVNDVLGPQRTGSGIQGLGVRWTPTDRTLLQADADNRYFGHSHSVSIQHRMARSVWTFSDSRDISDSAGAGAGSGGLRTLFDLLFSSADAVSAAPDPLQRARLVDEFLRINGLNRSSLASGGFLTTSVSLQRRQNLAVALNGVRTSVVVSAFRVDVQALNPQQAVIPQQAAGTGGRQYGSSLSIGHRLTPVSALSLEASWNRTAGSTAAAPASSAKALSVSWTRQMPRQGTVNVGARHNVSDGASGGYRESAIVATLTKRF